MKCIGKDLMVLQTQLVVWNVTLNTGCAEVGHLCIMYVFCDTFLHSEVSIMSYCPEH